MRAVISWERHWERALERALGVRDVVVGNVDFALRNVRLSNSEMGSVVGLTMVTIL